MLFPTLLIFVLSLEGYIFRNTPVDQYSFYNGSKTLNWYIDPSECQSINEDLWPAFDDLSKQDCNNQVMPLNWKDI